MVSPEQPDKPAGPNRAQSFNGFHMLAVSILIIVASVVFLRTAKSDDRDTVTSIVGIGLGTVGILIAVWMLRRYWWKRSNGLTLDEDDPRRTPEQQQWRDDRVRKQNAEMTPREEIIVGILLFPGAFVLPGINLLFGRAPVPGDLFLIGGLIILGVVLLVHGLVRRRRAA